MQSFTRRCAMAAVGAVLALGATGCFPSRQGVYREIEQERHRAYVRWRDNLDKDEMLPPANGPLSVVDAVKLALVHNPALQRTLQEQEKARGQVWTAYSQALPTLDANADYTRLDKVNQISVGTTTFPTGALNNYSVELSVTQPLIQGASIPAAIRGAKFFQFLNDEKVRQAVQDLIFTVVRDYYDVVLANHLYQVQVEALDFAKANLKDVTAREQAGVAIPFDELRARVEVSNVEADMIQQRNKLNRARTALLRVVGISQKSDVEMTDELAYVPMTPDFEKAVEAAFVNRPELYQAELDLRLQKEALRVYYSYFFPRLEAWGLQKWAYPDPHDQSFLEWGKQWTAGLRVRWTLFDGLKREGNIIQQKATLRQSVITLFDAEQAVLEQVKNATLDLNDADELVKSQQLNLERANEALRLVTVGADNGVNTELEVLDARSALTKARGLYYQALYAHAVARLTLQRAIGTLGTPPGTPTVPEKGPAPGVIPEFMTPAAGSQPAQGQAPGGEQAKPEGEANPQSPVAAPGQAPDATASGQAQPEARKQE